MGNFEKVTISSFIDIYKNTQDFVKITRIYPVLHIESYSVLSKYYYDHLSLPRKLL